MPGIRMMVQSDAAVKCSNNIANNFNRPLKDFSPRIASLRRVQAHVLFFPSPPPLFSKEQ